VHPGAALTASLQATVSSIANTLVRCRHTHSYLYWLYCMYHSVQWSTENNVVQDCTVHSYPIATNSFQLKAALWPVATVARWKRRDCLVLDLHRLCMPLSLSLYTRGQSFVRPFTLCCVASGYFQMFRSNLSMCPTMGLFGSNGKRKRKCKTFALLHFFFTFGSKHPKVQKGKCYRNFANYRLIRLNRFVSSFSPHLYN
jgi:hypothetical protein